MSGTTTVGKLRVLLTAGYAQFVADMGKARGAVKDALGDFTVFGRSGKDSEKVLIDIGNASTRELGKARQAVQLLTRSFGSLGGTVGQVGGLIGDFAGGNIGGFGLAAAGAAAAVTFAISRISTAWKELNAAEEAFAKEGTARVRKALEDRAEALDKKLGGSYQIIALRAAEAARAEEAAEAAEKAYNDSVWFGWRGSGAKQAEMLKTRTAANAAQSLAGQAGLDDAAKAREALEAINRSFAKLEGVKTTIAFREQIQSLPGPMRQAEEAIRRFNEELEENVETQLHAAGLTEKAMSMDPSLTDAERRRRRDQAEWTRASAWSVSFQHAEAQRAAAQREIERQRQPHPLDVEEAHRTGVAGGLIGLLKEEKVRREHAQRAAELRREGDEAAAGAAASRQRERDAETAAAGDAAAALFQAEDQYARNMAELRKSDLDVQLDLVRKKYAAMLEQAEDWGWSTLAIEAKIAEEQQRVRERAAEEARAKQLHDAVVGPSFGAGFKARVSQLEEEADGYLGNLGASMASLTTERLSGGLVDAIEDVTRGIKSARDAGRKWATSFMFDAARMIQQALLMKAVLSILPGLASAGGGGAGGGGAGPGGSPSNVTASPLMVGGSVEALESTFRAAQSVPSFLRVAQAGPGGATHITNVIQNHIDPDTSLQRASRVAKAQLVLSVTHRGGRRGARAAE